MKRPLLLVVSAVPMILLGCSSTLIESKKIEYKSAGKLPPLEIPPDLTRPTRDDRYAVPDVNPKGSATYSVYAGERVGAARATTAPDVLPQAEKMHIERSGSQRWLVVPGSPDKIWPNIKGFWQDLGFIVNVESPESGVMETDWAENRAKIPQDFIRGTLGKVFDGAYSTPERDKFRTRLEKGTEPGTTEIYISHRGMYEIYINEGKTDTRWQPRPADPDLEAEMLSRLMVRLGLDQTQAKAVTAETVTMGERASLLTAKEGGDALRVNEAFDRAWRRVGLALDRVGFTVEDRDRSQGLYFVRYVDPEIDLETKGSKSWLSKLAFWKGNKSDPKQTAQYRIRVSGDGENSRVQVLNRDGGVDRSDTAHKILNLLFDQLK